MRLVSITILFLVFCNICLRNSDNRAFGNPCKCYPIFEPDRIFSYHTCPLMVEEGNSEGNSCGLDEEDEDRIFKKLADEGVSLEVIYTGEQFGNFRGGLNTHQSGRYNGLLDVVVTFDLEKMGIGQGYFFVNAQQKHGRNLTGSQVGDFQVLSNLDSYPYPQPFTQVSEYWWEGKVLNERFRVKIGRQDANADFNVVDVGGDFIGSSFGFVPTIPLPSYPVPTLGISAFYDITENLMIKGGVYDGGTHLNEFGTSKEGVPFFIMEIKEQYEVSGRPGDIHAGVWHHEGEFENLIPALGPVNVKNFHNCTGFYAGLDQMIYQENPEDEDSDEGLAMFLQYGWAPPDHWAAEQYYGAGAVYKGLLPGRNDDLLGVGVASVEFSKYLPQERSETAIEFFYKMQVNKYLILQPDLQIIRHPSGLEKTAVAGGVRFELMAR